MIAAMVEPQLMESGAVARQLGIAIETLHKWERVGRISPPRRTVGGRRLYSPEEVERIRRVREERMGPSPLSLTPLGAA